MIVVLAKSEGEYRRWLKRSGLSPRHACYLGSSAGGRGRHLTSSDVVQLPGFADRHDVDRFAAVLAPCGVSLSQVAVLPVPL